MKQRQPCPEILKAFLKTAADAAYSLQDAARDRGIDGEKRVFYDVHFKELARSIESARAWLEDWKAHSEDDSDNEA